MRKDVSVDIKSLLGEAGESAGLGLFTRSEWGGLDRRTNRPRIQKPGLALSGFTKHVYGDRIQILGLTEIDYLVSIPESDARENLEKYISRGLCALVITRGLEPPAVLMEVARAHGVVVLGTELMTSTFIQRITRRLEDLLSPTATVHGVLVDVLGVGVLLIGRSGVGKSEAALDLVLKGHRLVADDVVQVTMRPPDTVWGAATELHQHYMEIRGMGILNITHLFGVAAVRDNKKLEVVVELSEIESSDFDRLGTESNVWPILTVDVPLVRIPLRAGRNIASLIEVVARNQLLKRRGHDSAREFQDKVNARIRAGVAAVTSGTPQSVPRSSSQIIGVNEVE